MQSLNWGSCIVWHSIAKDCFALYNSTCLILRHAVGPTCWLFVLIVKLVKLVHLLFPFVLLPDMFIWWNKDFQRSSASPRLEAVGWRCKSVCLRAGAMYAEVQKRQQNHSRGGLAPAAGGRGGGRGKGPPQRAPPPPPNGQSTNPRSAHPGYVGITIVNNIYCTSGS